MQPWAKYAADKVGGMGWRDFRLSIYEKPSPLVPLPKGGDDPEAGFGAKQKKEPPCGARDFC